MSGKAALWRDWKLHVVVLVLTVIAERIGTHRIPLGPGVIVLFPMLYAMVLGLAVYLSRFTTFVKKAQADVAESMILLAIAFLLARIGTLIGPSLPRLLAAGPALILQEFGNLATMLIALPLAIALGLGRETIGMTHSVGREPNVGLIIDVYGFDSAEGRGVMGVYIVGTLIGAVFMAVMAGFLATILPLHPLAFAMASGIGSASMMVAASGSLVHVFPEYRDQIVAFAGASNLLTSATGLYMSIFIALPLANKLYALLTPRIGRRSEEGAKGA